MNFFKPAFKNFFTRKISAAVLTAVLLFVSIFSISAVSGASSFLPRLTAPGSGNKYYYSDLNVFYKYGYGMPNCTAYAYGRAYEILGSQPKLSRYSAETWYDYNKENGCYSYGKSPKLGAIACWTYDGGGHVAVVEAVDGDTITFSNSAYGEKNFYLTYADVDDKLAGGSSLWSFQGYIYLGSFEKTGTTAKTDTSAGTGVYKTNVDSGSYLSLRSGAGTGYDLLAKIPDGAELTITKVKSAGGYTWGYTSYKGTKGWAALDFCDFVSAAAQQTTAAPSTKATAAPTTTRTTEPVTISPPLTLPTGELMGDVNLDNLLNINDVTAIQKYIAKIIDFSDEQLALADYDGDKTVNICDATEISKYIAGII